MHLQYGMYCYVTIMRFNVAIDGTSGVGKSTIAKQLAKHYHMIHIDTGAMYRSIAYYLQEDDSDIEKKLNHINIELKQDEVWLNHENITDKIRNDRISLLASKYAKNPQIRSFLVKKQQEIAKSKGFILDGRDIGSVVLPDAEIKIFLEANATVRAKRRYQEYIAKGQDVTYTQVYEDIITRDEADYNRKESPLVKVNDAYVIDTSEKTIEEIVCLIETYIESKVKV